MLVALVGVGWLLSLAEGGGGRLDVGVGTWDGVVVALDGGGESYMQTCSAASSF